MIYECTPGQFGLHSVKPVKKEKGEAPTFLVTLSEEALANLGVVIQVENITKDLRLVQAVSKVSEGESEIARIHEDKVRTRRENKEPDYSLMCPQCSKYEAHQEDDLNFSCCSCGYFFTIEEATGAYIQAVMKPFISFQNDGSFIMFAKDSERAYLSIRNRMGKFYGVILPNDEVKISGRRKQRNKVDN